MEKEDPQVAKKGRDFKMKLNPNFMKQGKNDVVIVSPRAGTATTKNHKRDLSGTDRGQHVRRANHDNI